jgi:hypothetical protein
MKRAPMTKIEHPLHLMIRYVDPDRVRCPVVDCEDEGLEENRITTPFIAGLGPLEVYLCSAHAAQLAAAFLELQPSITDFSSDVVQWDEPRELTRQVKSMPDPTPEQELDPVFQAISRTIKDWDINVPEYYEGYCGATGSHVALILNALEKIWKSSGKPISLPGPIELPVRPGEAGALFAFMGWLTSRKEVSGPFSGHHEAGQGAHLVGEFIRMQGWQEPPDGWWHCIKPYTEEEKEVLGRVHMENYRTRMDLEPVSSLEDISYGHAPYEEV